MVVVKPLYGLAEAGTHWWATYFKHHKEKLQMETLPLVAWRNAVRVVKFRITNFPCNLESTSDSTASWDSRNGPRPPNLTPHPHRHFEAFAPRARHDYNTAIPRDDRIRIHTALLFHIPHDEIRHKLDVTERQIQWAKYHLPTPQKDMCHVGKVKLRTPQRRQVEEWLLASPSHRNVPFRRVPEYMDRLEGAGEQDLGTAFKLLGYKRRRVHRKGFSDEPLVKQLRLDFARQGLTWTRRRIYRQMFSDEVWAMGGAHTTYSRTVRSDGSEDYRQNSQHKYNKVPAWMFHSTIIDGRKGPARFWEKEEGNITCYKYDLFILLRIQEYVHEHEDEQYIFMHDNASVTYIHISALFS
ncbi:hypothetical protein B0J14DRAFT_658827 [Halenospora varia]|nr:hypothetical protein B0J14DRAFT_658827 [Halenospora varia]